MRIRTGNKRAKKMWWFTVPDKEDPICGRMVLLTKKEAQRRDVWDKAVK